MPRKQRRRPAARAVGTPRPDHPVGKATGARATLFSFRDEAVVFECRGYLEKYQALPAELIPQNGFGSFDEKWTTEDRFVWSMLRPPASSDSFGLVTHPPPPLRSGAIDEDSEQRPIPAELQHAVREIRRHPQDDDLVLLLIAGLGLDALHPRRVEGYLPPWMLSAEERELWSELRTHLWNRLFTWYAEARAPGLRRAPEAARRLKRLGTILAGNRRGRRQTKGASPDIIAGVYFSTLYSLLLALRLLIGRPELGEDAQLPLLAAKCVLPESLLRHYLTKSTVGRTRSVPLPPETVARKWTAALYRVTEKTVVNAPAIVRGRLRLEAERIAIRHR